MLRYEYDKKESIELNQLQIETRNNFLAKINSQIYRMEEVKCICGSDDYEVLSEKDRYGLPVRNVICKSCGLVFINPRMTKKSYDEFYQKEYRNLYNGVEIVTPDYYNSRVAHGKWIYYYLTSNGLSIPGKVLEIGCGSGGILEAFKNEGWDVTGIDLNATYFDYGKARGLNLIWGHSRDLLETKEESFDLIILNHVIEHFLDINDELSIVNKLLKEGGRLYIETPGIKNLLNSYEQDLLRYLQNAHTYSFTLNTLSQVLGWNGFTLVNGDELIHSVYKKDRIFTTKCVNYYQEVISFLLNLEKRTILNKEQNYSQKRGDLYLKKFSELKEKIKSFPEQSVVIYGTGNHTRMLLSFLGDERRIYCLTDQDSNKFGQTYLGYPIYDLNKIVDQIKAIVISSTVYQEMIYQRIKHFKNQGIDIIKIYNDEFFSIT